MSQKQAFELDYRSLRRIVIALLRMAVFAGEFGQETILRSVHRAVTRLLRPAEAAARRLIFVLARGITVTLPPARTVAPKPDDRRPDNMHAEPVPRPVDRDPVRLPPLVLVEPLPDFPSDKPRAFAGILPVRGDEEISGVRLADRLDALCHALDDLQAQAERLARWRALRLRAGTRRPLRHPSVAVRSAARPARSRGTAAEEARTVRRPDIRAPASLVGGQRGARQS